MIDRSDTVLRYSRVAMLFHWTIAALVIVNLTIGLLHDAIGGMALHKAVGLTVLALTVARLVWRLSHKAPPLPAHMPGWERAAAHATHWTLYLLMVAMPLTGWLMVSGGPTPRPTSWFGLAQVPPLPVGRAAGGFGHEAHELLGWLMLALVLLHVAAALRHHFLLRDGMLARMAPGLDRGVRHG